MLEQIKALLEEAQPRVYGTGDVPNGAPLPYWLVYSLQPTQIRSLSREEGARRFRFGVTVVDLGSQYIESDADAVEQVLEGSRVLGSLSRIELVSRGPVRREPEVTADGQEYTTLPLHFTTTIPKGAA